MMDLPEGLILVNGKPACEVCKEPVQSDAEYELHARCKQKKDDKNSKLKKIF